MLDLKIKNIHDSIFEKGYPKVIHYKHFTEKKIIKCERTNCILQVVPSRMEFFKVFYSSMELFRFIRNKNLKLIGSKLIESKDSNDVLNAIESIDSNDTYSDDKENSFPDLIMPKPRSLVRSETLLNIFIDYSEDE